MAYSPTTALEIARRVMEEQYRLAAIGDVYQGVLRDVLRKGMGCVSLKIDDRRRGYSQSHWRKIKKQHQGLMPVTIRLNRVSPWITALNTGEAP